MENFGPFHWLIVLAIILLLVGWRRISDLARSIGGGPGAPPTHPLPVTSPVEAPNSGERKKRATGKCEICPSVSTSA
jgi:hypothetical protein